jgi:hypothetical protein
MFRERCYTCRDRERRKLLFLVQHAQVLHFQADLVGGSDRTYCFIRLLDAIFRI